MRHKDRLKGLQRHHLIPRSRKGKGDLNNILYLTAERHAAWHKIFGTMTLSEIIQLLKRVERMKKNVKTSKGKGKNLLLPALLGDKSPRRLAQEDGIRGFSP